VFPTGKPFDMMTRGGKCYSNTDVESGLDSMGCLSVFTPSPQIAKISGWIDGTGVV